MIQKDQYDCYSLFYTGCIVDVAQVKGVTAVSAQLYLSVSCIISFNIFNNFMRGPPYIWKIKCIHTYMKSLCMISLCHCLSLIVWDGHAYAMVCFWLSESDLCCSSVFAFPLV